MMNSETPSQTTLTLQQVSEAYDTVRAALGNQSGLNITRLVEGTRKASLVVSVTDESKYPAISEQVDHILKEKFGTSQCGNVYVLPGGQGREIAD